MKLDLKHMFCVFQPRDAEKRLMIEIVRFIHRFPDCTTGLSSIDPKLNMSIGRPG